MNKKGFTLIELLAVIVIMGIILAIAIPSVGGILENSKKQSYVKNAQILTNTVKTEMMSAEHIPATPGHARVYTLEYLKTKGLLDDIKDPDGGNLDEDLTYVVALRTSDIEVKYYVQVHGKRTIKLSTKNPNQLDVSDVGSETAVGTTLTALQGVFGSSNITAVKLNDAN